MASAAIDISLDDDDKELANIPQELPVRGDGAVKVSRNKPWYKDADFVKLIVMLVLVAIFCVAELVVGMMTGSLTLITDAFHMISDASGLVIALVGLVLAKKKSNINFSYGYARAGLIGGLVNAVFLLSVVMFIYLDVVERFMDPKKLEQPWLVLAVALGGALVNLIGIFMFCGHFHHHGDDGGHHHHHASDTSKEAKKTKKKKQHKHEHKKEQHDHHEHHDHEHEHDHDHDETEHHHEKHDHHDHEEEGEPHNHAHTESHDHHHHGNENMVAVLLHIAGDFLGSIGVIVSVIVIMGGRKLFGEEADAYTQYVDPIISLLIATILVVPTVPLIVRCIRVLMQSVPEHVRYSHLKDDLEGIKYVHGVHELHVWSLTRNERIIASVHLVAQCETLATHEQVHEAAVQVFHKHGVHSVTVQIEQYDSKKQSKQCARPCMKECTEKKCCTETDDEKAAFLK